MKRRNQTARNVTAAEACSRCLQSMPETTHTEAALVGTRTGINSQQDGRMNYHRTHNEVTYRLTKPGETSGEPAENSSHIVLKTNKQRIQSYPAGDG